MSDRFAVDPAVSSGVTEGITRAMMAFGSAGGQGSAVSEAATGHPGVTQALGTFGERWTQGVEHLVKEGQGGADGLTRIAVAYQRVERWIAQALRAVGPL